MAADKYFSYDDDSGFETHATEADAKKAAEVIVERYSDESCGEEWDECVSNVCWGEIKQQASLMSTLNFVEFQGQMVESYEAQLIDIE